jgi:predicted amidohydrolase
VRIAVIQFAPALLDREETIRRLDPLFAQCDAVDLVVLPELANSGYAFAGRDEAMQSAESIGDSPFLDHLTQRCAGLGCEIVTGFCEHAGERLYNSAVLLSARGVEGVYRKLHLFMNEPDYFQPGDLGLPVFERPYGVIGIQVCFDWAFYEGWRVLALNGVELICHPANLVIPGRAQSAIPIYAMTNRIFIATANRIGTERELTFTGTSVIADPSGGLVDRAPASEAVVMQAEIGLELARDKMVTPRNHAFGDRRSELYGDLCEP